MANEHEQGANLAEPAAAEQAEMASVSAASSDAPPPAADASPAPEALPPAEAAPAPEAAPGPLNPGQAFRIALPSFEGPLDLLLHLIREHKIDIFDIPIALITEKYLQTLKLMKELDLDIAGEFLLMAATLAHIKSRMLLPNPEPVPEEDEPQADPREELVKRLLQYQKFKAAADELARQDLLDREVFTRRAHLDQIPLGDNEVGFVEVSIFKLIQALDRALKNAKVEIQHQVLVDRISLSETITAMVERLKATPRSSLLTVLEGNRSRLQILMTFLALLEMTKLGLIRIYQEEGEDDILISARDPESLGGPAEIKDDYK